MQIGDLGIVKGDLGVLGIVVDLHRLDVRGGDLAVRALVFGVAAFLQAGAVGLPGLPSASVGGCRVNLQGYLFRCVLLRLRLSSHGLKRKKNNNNKEG